jgi:hypothetical protein
VRELKDLINNIRSGSMDIFIKSPAFGEGQMIPREYTCVGRDVSPPLEWSNIPEGTASIAIICDDPDAPMGTWVHWVIYNIPPSQRGLDAEIPTKRELAGGAIQGINSFQKIGYGGPCPPAGTHRYYFKIYALDTLLENELSATKETVQRAMNNHILARGELMGKFSR